MHTDIIDKFTTHLKNVLTRALCLVLETKEKNIEPLHLFWALATQKGSIGAEILNKIHITEKTVTHLFQNNTAKLPLEPHEKRSAPQMEKVAPKLSTHAKRAIEKAVLTANLYEHKYIGTEHLLSGILQTEDAKVKQFLTDHHIEIKTLRGQVMLVLKGTSKFPNLAASLGIAGDDDLQEMGSDATTTKKRSKKTASKTPALDFFAVDLTNVDVQATIDPVIGREEEIARMMQILCRRTKNNPILLGDPGVGKTALVEGLAKRIAQGNVPEVLQNKRILNVDLSLIVAGTMYRGEFEGRLKQIIDEVKAHPDIVLFIDEVHTIIGAGSASGSLDAANILKPALARGEIRCIGATTLDEYKKHIESDSALERRFQSVAVNEPNKEKTIKIMEGIKKNYETFHNVSITKDAICAAVELADRYLQDKFFPDKAIDLVDEASSSMRVKQKPSARQKKMQTLQEELTRVRAEKRQAVIEEKFIEAIALKEQERALEETWNKFARTGRNKKEKASGRITAKHIAEIVSRMTGIPTAELVDEEKTRLTELEKTLQKYVVGQDPILKTVSEYVRRAKTGITHPSRPLASFLFIGPSGVGKTELAKVLAREVFQGEDALVRLDMSEFAEGFTVSKLIGAPAGYVGYRDSAKLTDAIKRKPYSVVLFDELEKGHPDVLNLLLQILDEGHITDATGRMINFKNTILIMTSNIGSEKIGQHAVGFSAGDQHTRQNEQTLDVLAALRERFRPEFLNRIDRICAFQALDAEALTRIVDLQIKELNERLADKRVHITITDEACDWIVARGTHPEQGARAVKRIIQEHVESALASFLLEVKPYTSHQLSFVLKDEKPMLVEKRAKEKLGCSM